MDRKSMWKVTGIVLWFVLLNQAIWILLIQSLSRCLSRSKKKKVVIHNFLFPQGYHYVITQRIYHCIIGSVCQGSVTSFQTSCEGFDQSAFSVEGIFHYNI